VHRVEEVHADDAAGSASAAAICVIGSEDVFVASRTSGPSAEPSSAKMRVLSSSFSGTASITTSTPRTAAASSVAPDSRASAASRSGRRDLALGDALLEVSAHGGEPALERVLRDVEQARLQARLRQRLRDPVPHRARAEHGGGLHPGCIHRQLPGTSTILPDTLRALEQLVRLARAAQRQHAVDHGAVPATRELVHDHRQRAARTHRRAEHRLVLDEQVRQHDRDRRPGRRAARHEPSVAREAAHRAVPRRRPDVLDDDVDAATLRQLPQLLVPAFLRMVERDFGAEREREAALLFAAGGGEHARARGPWRSGSPPSRRRSRRR
jgi:hypothetical protein